MRIGELLQAEIPRGWVLRFSIATLVAMSYLALYGVVAITLSPRSSGETMGEFAMARGGFFLAVIPWVAAFSIAVASFVAWRRERLDRAWLLFGISPVFVLIVAIGVVLLRF